MKLILCGACGRMGRIVSELVQNTNDSIVCGVDLSPSPAPFPVYASFAEITEQAEAVIDFSSAHNLRERLDFCIRKKMPILLAATGYSDEDTATVLNAAKEIPVFKTGNLSLGVNLLQYLAKKAAEILGEGFDVEIIERHHNKKKDAPSGTALMLAKSVNEGFSQEKKYTYGRHGIVGEREKSEIGIHAVRGGTIVGEHEVMFAGEDEIVTLSHSARSRKVFASGALKAAAWLKNQPAGLYDMSHLLKDIVK